MLTYEQAKARLAEYGQEGLLRCYDSLDDAGKATLLSQIEELDFSLLSCVDAPEAPRGKLAPLGALEADVIARDRERFTAIGADAIRAGKVAAVLLAGGQGTRLGFDGPKGACNIGITREFYIFEALFNNMMDVVRAVGADFPLYIMTSDKNHEQTVAFLTAHNFFGYNAEKVTFFKQDMAPSVNFDGKFMLEAPDRLVRSPNGNGGWFSSMVRAGLLDKLQAEGVEWLNAFAVDNVLQRICDPCFIGATIDSGRECGAKVVRKADPQERVGVLCTEDGTPSIVEYYEMTEEMITRREPNGDLSYNFGVILNYLFPISRLVEIWKEALPMHVAKKKIPFYDENGVYQKPEEPNGYKFESLILDMVHKMRSCLSYEVVRDREFAPIKQSTGVDSVESARALLAKNGVTL